MTPPRKPNRNEPMSNIRRARVQAGYTQEELAEILGITKRGLRNRESGKSDNVERILTHLETIGCSVTWPWQRGEDR